MSRSACAVVDRYCAGCHDADTAKGGLNLEPVPGEEGGGGIRRCGRRSSGGVRAADAAGGEDAAGRGDLRLAVVSQLETALDRAAAERPNPGRTDTIRRLTRTEYQNAIRDLLALDDRRRGAAAGRRVQPRVRQRDGGRPLADAAGPLHHGGAEDQPAGGRRRAAVARRRHDPRPAGHHPGGARRGAAARARAAATLIRYTFPQDGEYEIQVRLARDRNEHVEGLHEPHELEVLLDRERVKSFTVKPPPGGKGPRERRRAPEGPRSR